MSLRRYRLAGSSSSTANAVDTMQVQRNGTIRQISISFQFDSVTDNALAKLQVSRQATNDFQVAAGGTVALSNSVAEAVACGNFATSGLSQMVSTIVIPCNDKVSVGELLYYHVVISGTVTVQTDIVISIDE